MLNYEIESSILIPYLPEGTELDTWKGKHLVSVVGFQFFRTRIFGIPVPYHCHFEEVNLRFYVRRKSDREWRRGVVFIREIVPRSAIAFTAQSLYNEPYIALPMAHRIEGNAGEIKSAQYSWQFSGQKNHLKLDTSSTAQPMSENSEAEFIAEHYWGYNKQRDGSTLEYQVEHPRWRIYQVANAELDCDVAGLYGDEFREGLSCEPSSVFLAEGSAVTVYRGVRLAP